MMKMRPAPALAFLFALLLCFLSALSHGAERVALVVGNSAYAKAPLDNPANDSAAMSRVLRGLGFQVIEKQNLNRRDFAEAIRELSSAVDEGGIALFFFAGHGIQVKGENYLMPVGADVKEEFDVPDECVSLDRVLSAMEVSESGLNIVFLDCCRNNPYKRGWRRSNEKGLAQTLVPEGTLISFAAAPGKEALDGKGNNSPFTEALLANLPKPGLPLTDALMAARKQVYDTTRREQRPWISHDLLEKVILKAGTLATTGIPMKPTLPKPPSPAERLRSATKDSPFVNSLGLEFIPVPGKPGVYLCRTETRVRDFAAFVKATGHDATAGAYTLENGGWEQAGGTWKNPRFPSSTPQTGDHPVTCVSWEDAVAFCEWLSNHSAEKGLVYRLPSDAEWSAAVGVGKYPWGSTFPPPKGAGNYAGSEANIGSFKSNNFSVIEGYDDGAPRTLRVGSYGANRFGFFDLGGNVWEWCDDWYRDSMNDPDVIKFYKENGLDDGGGRKYRVLRGGSWSDDLEIYLRSSGRSVSAPAYRGDGSGFRVVVEVVGG